MDAAAITAIGAIFTGLVVLFLKFTSDIRKSQEVRDEAFVESLNNLTKSNERIANETSKSGKIHIKGLAEAEKRNGHLAELQIESKASNDKNSLAILKAIANLPTQHVKNQHVDTQTVNEEIVKKQVTGE